MKLPWGKLRASDATSEFWSWFAGQARTFDVKSPSHQAELGKRLQRINKELTWGVSAGSNGEASTLEISASGIPQLIPIVQAVVGASPDIPGWNFVAFRQPAETFSIKMGSNEISPQSVYWDKLAETSGRVDIALYLPLPDHLARIKMGFIVLDHSLGEYLVMTRVGAIDFHPYTLAPSSARPLSTLAPYLLKAS